MARLWLAALLLLALALPAAPASLAAEVQAKVMGEPLPGSGACGDPPWLVHGLDVYKRDSCEARAWAQQRIGRIGDTERTLEGRRQVASYTVASGAQRMTGPAVQRAFLDALKSIGATLLTAEDNQDRFVATQTTPAGEFWIIYEAGGGSADARTSFSLTSWMIAPMPQEVQAQALAGPLPKGAPCADPPWLVHGLSMFKRGDCDAKDWTTQSLRGLAGGDRTLEGSRLAISYVLIDRANTPTGMAVQRNFLAAFKAIGASIVSKEDDGDQVVASQTTPAGEVWYIYEAGGGNSDARTSFTLTTMVITPFVQEVEARALTGPLSTDAACGDPPWVAHALSYFKPGDCDARDWGRMILRGLPGGDRMLEGTRTSVNYGIADPSRRPPGILVQRNFLNALKAIGAKILSAEDDQDRVVATQTTPAGETWYIYLAGGGSADTRTSYTLTTLVSGPFVQEVVVRPMADGVQAPGKACADPPWLARQFASYTLGNCEFQDFAPLKIKLADGEHTLVGRVLSTNYSNADRHHVRIAAAVWRNYVDALQAGGAKLVSDPKDMSAAVLTQRVGDAEYWFIYRMGNGTEDAVANYALQTLQIGGPPPKACTLKVYGVNFDFDKASLRPDSEPVLKQVLALFTGTPEFAAEVGGHTDNIGKPPYNLKLSEARAAAVKTWLVGHGVAAARVRSHGYGDTRPLVPNTTDENRFKNRRVELKRANCK